ncbi:MAG: MFS transporter [Pseudomonadota bacterium]
MLTHKHNPLTLTLVVGCGMFLSTLDSGITKIALPTLIKSFNTNIAVVIWSVTLYALVLSASILLFGHLADRLGRLRIYVFGLILFAFSSLLCGASLSIGMLIFCRGIQGLSAAMMQATSIALITTRLRAAELTKAMSILGMLIGLGPMLGPVIGGSILSTLGWRWIFWINIPICLLALYGCRRLPAVDETRHKTPIHYLNLILITLTLAMLLLGMSMLSDKQFYLAWFLFAIAIISFIFYLILELISKHPLIPLGLFKQRRFSAPILGIMAFGGGTAVIFMMPPLYFEQLRHFQAWQVGLICLSAPLGIVISARTASKIIHYIGTATSMITGLIVMLFSLIILTQIKVNWSVPFIFLLLLCYGLGGGLFQTPCYLNIMAQFPEHRQAFIGALVRMLQNVAIVFQSAGAALILSLQARHLLSGIQYAWWMSAIIIAIALIAFLPRAIVSK